MKDDPRINRTRPGPGRPPLEFKVWCRQLFGRLGGRDHDVAMQCVRHSHVDQIDVVPADHPLPVPLHLLPSPAVRHLAQRPLIAAADDFPHGDVVGLKEKRHIVVRMAVGLAHEPVADQSHIHRLQVDTPPSSGSITGRPSR